MSTASCASVTAIARFGSSSPKTGPGKPTIICEQTERTRHMMVRAEPRWSNAISLALGLRRLFRQEAGADTESGHASTFFGRLRCAFRAVSQPARELQRSACSLSCGSTSSTVLSNRSAHKVLAAKRVEQLRVDARPIVRLALPSST